MTPPHAPGRLVLLGHPVAHSLSPAMQNAALEHAGIPLRYEALDTPVEQLDGTLAALARTSAAGNVTIPHKQAIHARCVRRSAVAERTGAVNVFWHEDGALVGDNTDVGGFSAAVAHLMGGVPRAITVGVLGAGGAAAAVLAAVESWGRSRALVHNRTAARAADLCARFSSGAECADAARIAREADLVVNATSIGLHDDELPMRIDALRPSATIFDLVYRRGETAFVRAARAAGHRATDGLPMLVEQGALAFECWFGFSPDRSAMWRAAR
jgi:shikimate dehydrogenase